MKLLIKEVEEDNLGELLQLKIKPSQKGFVEPIEECLEDAEEYPEYCPVGLYIEDEPIGFAMYGCFNENTTRERVWLDRLLIDKEEQGKGLGKKSFETLIDLLEDEYHCNKIYLSVFEDNKLAIDLYKKFGFQYTGEIDINGEKIMSLDL